MRPREARRAVVRDMQRRARAQGRDDLRDRNEPALSSPVDLEQVAADYARFAGIARCEALDHVRRAIEEPEIEL